MYNLLVTAEEEAWNSGYYTYDKSRFLEYTDTKIYDKFKSLTPRTVRKLKKLPTLFAYEGKDNFVSIGFISSIKERENGKKVFIEFEIVLDNFIHFSSLKPLTEFLDIRKWEMNRTHWAIKDDDLLDRLLTYNLISQSEFDRLSQDEKMWNIQEDISYAKDLTIPREEKVASLRGFISKVMSKNSNQKEEIFYRGHSNQEKYKLEPSLFRKDSEGNYVYLESEDILYKELISSNPSEFSSDQFTIDKLMRMQHYSLPTRLLDITSNPLIALYFACKNNPDKKGEVIIFSIAKKKIKYFDSDTVSCIANLVRLPKHEMDKIVFKLEKEPFNEQLAIKRLLHFIREEKSFFESKIEPQDLRKIVCIKGKKNNDRISSQSGAFLLFGIDTILDENGTEDIDIRRITIEDKEKILEELDILNINESTVFPYIENSAKYVASKYSFKELK